MANKNYMKRTFGDFSQRIQEKNGTSGGGSVIVDSLPANGVEGQTYLLRKTTEIPGYQAMKFDRVYIQIGQVVGKINPSILLISDTYTGDDLRRGFEEKLNFNGLEWINITDPANIKDYIFPTFVEDKMLNQPTVAIVENESEIASLDFDTIEVVYQKIENITLNDFCGLQVSDVGSFPEIICTLNELIPTNSLNSLSMKTENINGTFVGSNRKLIVDDLSGKLTPEFGEWETYEMGHIEGTLTNTYSTDSQYFQDLVDEEKQYYGYLLLIDDQDGPSTYEYSYTEYVFDNGVYTEIGSNNSGNGATIGDNFLLEAGFLEQKLESLSTSEGADEGHLTHGNFKFDVYNFISKHLNRFSDDHLEIMLNTTLSYPHPSQLYVEMQNTSSSGIEKNVIVIRITNEYSYSSEVVFEEEYPISNYQGESFLEVMRTFEFSDEDLENLFYAISELFSHFSGTGPNEGLRHILFSVYDSTANGFFTYNGYINLTANDIFCDLFRLEKIESNYKELDKFIN